MTVIQYTLRSRVPYVTRVLRACVPYMLRALRARVPYVPPALRTLVSHVLRYSDASCLLCLIYIIKTIMSKCFPNMFLS